MAERERERLFFGTDWMGRNPTFRKKIKLNGYKVYIQWSSKKEIIGFGRPYRCIYAPQPPLEGI